MAKPEMNAAHMKAHGTKMIVVGILIILNANYGWLDWATFVGVIFILVGLVKISKPCVVKK
ncbi:MAG: hypothetical protein V3V78_04950 [Candidatus Woesearchaeota archaeon]